MDNRGLWERTPSPKILVVILLLAAAGLVIKLVNKPAYEIYIVTPESVKAARSYNSSTKDSEAVRHDKYLNLLAIDGKAILTDKHIKSYDWNTHRIEFNEKFIKKQKKLNNVSLDKILTQYDGLDFLVVVKGHRMYTGYIQSLHIRTGFVKGSTGIDLIDSNSVEIFSSSENIGNTKIYKALKSTGKLIE